MSQLSVLWFCHFLGKGFFTQAVVTLLMQEANNTHCCHWHKLWGTQHKSLVQILLWKVSIYLSRNRFPSLPEDPQTSQAEVWHLSQPLPGSPFPLLLCCCEGEGLSAKAGLSSNHCIFCIFCISSVGDKEIVSFPFFLLRFRCVLLCYSMSPAKKKSYFWFFWPNLWSQDNSNPAHCAFNEALLLRVTASTTAVRCHSISIVLTSQSLEP